MLYGVSTPLSDPSVSSNEPDESGGEVDGGEEVTSDFVVASGDGAEELEFSKKFSIRWRAL